MRDYAHDGDHHDHNYDDYYLEAQISCCTMMSSQNDRDRSSLHEERQHRNAEASFGIWEIGTVSVSRTSVFNSRPGPNIISNYTNALSAWLFGQRYF